MGYMCSAHRWFTHPWFTRCAGPCKKGQQAIGQRQVPKYRAFSSSVLQLYLQIQRSLASQSRSSQLLDRSTCRSSSDLQSRSSQLLDKSQIQLDLPRSTNRQLSTSIVPSQLGTGASQIQLEVVPILDLARSNYRYRQPVVPVLDLARSNYRYRQPVEPVLDLARSAVICAVICTTQASKLKL